MDLDEMARLHAERQTGIEEGRVAVIDGAILNGLTGETTYDPTKVYIVIHKADGTLSVQLA